MKAIHGTEPATETKPWVHGWRRAVLAGGMLVYPLVSAIGVSQNSHGAAAVTGYAIVLAFSCCYVLAAIAAFHNNWRWYWSLFAVMTALSITELPFARADAFFMAAVPVSFAAALVRRYALWIVAGGALTGVLVPWAIRPWHSGPVWIDAPMIGFTAISVYAFSELITANRALSEARTEVARLASEAERNRIARDLHDLLGHSLTVITVKSSLARRLAASDSPTDAARAFQEIAEVETLSRQALTEVRAAVSGYREVTLAGELARGRELLRAAGVTADLPTATGQIDAAHQELFGWAIREGLTNVARHARATRCTVTLSTAQVEIRDDGIGGPPSTDGNGLTGLRERVSAIGGSVEAGPLSPRGWRLRVSLEPATDRTHS